MVEESSEETKATKEEVENEGTAGIEIDDGSNGEEAAENVVELDSAEKKAEPVEDFKEKFYYLAAEMENMKRRFDREKQNLLKYGTENLLKDLIEVVDNFERTTSALNGDEDEKIKNIAVGVDMVQKQFLGTLEKHGLKLVETIGTIFDPNFHEAVAQEAAADKKDQEIVKEYQRGYVLNGRLLRASKVVIAQNV